MTFRNAATSLLCLLVLSSAASAQADDADAWRSPLTLEAQTGVFTPVGIAGAIVTYTPHERISLMAGAGMTLNGEFLHGSEVSWRAAVGVRHRIAYSLSHAFSMDYWVSAGPWSATLDNRRNRWDALVLLHVTPTWEYNHSSGFRFRMSLGVASNFYQRVSYTNGPGRVNPDEPNCTQCNSEGRRYLIAPSTSMSLGYAF